MNQPTTAVPVQITVQVRASQARAFEVFTDRFGTWWPMEHHIGAEDAVDAIVEPRVGGRWFERAADGSECEWGSVLEWDPPNRVVLAWHLTPEFVYDADPALATRVEVRFVAEGDDTTRVELVHSGFEVHGERAASMGEAVGSDGGWAGIMRGYAAAVDAS